MASFAEAFKKARKEMGAGKTFTWNGKKYTTDYKEEAGKAMTKPKANPRLAGGSTSASSPRPKANPRMGAAPKMGAPSVGRKDYKAPMDDSKAGRKAALEAKKAASRAGSKVNKTSSKNK